MQGNYEKFLDWIRCPNTRQLLGINKHTKMSTSKYTVSFQIEVGNLNKTTKENIQKRKKRKRNKQECL